MTATACSNHAKASAVWKCESCGKSFCDECINLKAVGMLELTSCRECGGRCLPLNAEGEVEMPVSANTPSSPRRFVETRSFFELLPSAFGYPFAASGYAFLIIGALLISALPLIRTVGLYGMIAGIIVLSYLIAYLFKITQSTANGENEMPNWPSWALFWSDVIQPYFIFVAAMAVCFFPVLGYVALSFWLRMVPFNLWVGVGLFLLGLLYYPGGVMAAVIYDNVVGLSPIIVLPAILRLKGAYAVTCLVFLLMMIIQKVLTMLLQGLPLSIMSHVAGALVSFYFLIVQFRILGLLYRSNEKNLKWFGNLIDD